MTNQPMNDERLAEIEAEHDGCEGYIDTMELIAEVRRLRERERLLEACLDVERKTGDTWRDRMDAYVEERDFACDERDEALARVAKLKGARCRFDETWKCHD